MIGGNTSSYVEYCIRQGRRHQGSWIFRVVFLHQSASAATLDAGADLQVEGMAFSRNDGK